MSFTHTNHVENGFLRPVTYGHHMKGARVLITGGAGFIGSKLANYLVNENDVIVVDNLALGDERNLDNDVNYRNQSVLATDLPTDVDVVFHLAALSSVTDHERDIERLRRGVDVNVKGFVNLVEQARTSGCDSVVYASSSAVYGLRRDAVRENSVLSPPNAYAASKLARERYAEFFTNAYGMNMAAMRFFSVYQEPTHPQSELREAANIITKLAADVAHGRSPEVFGDGTHERDFIHVEDIVRGLEMAAEHHLSGAYNLGTGESYSINAIIEMLADSFDSSVEPTYVDNPIPEHMFIKRLVADSSKIEEATGWTPRISIQEGIRRIQEAFQSQ